MTHNRAPELCYIDVGGTFTDAFIVDAEGDYTLGKAPSTRDDISEGFFASIGVAAEKWEMSVDDILSRLKVLGYGSTVVLNGIITRSGRTPGLLVTSGFEDLLLMERGKQTWTEMDRAARLHPVTHRHVEPLVPRDLVRGVTGRLDCFGAEIVPLHEDEIRAAAAYLLDRGVDTIVVSFMWSFLNPDDELRAREAIQAVMQETGTEGRVVLSFEVSPVVRELPRTNAAVIEAYAGPLARSAFQEMQEALERRGFKGDLQIMQSAGGLAPAVHVKAVDTIQSGPAGGVIGGRYIGEIYEFDNVITTDVGGTTFDVGLVTDGFINVNREPTVARMLLGVPMIEILSIGAGGGTIARVDTLTGRLAVGPRSAGADPGPVCYGRGGDEPTVTDADLILGYLNADYFVGGRLELDFEGAKAALASVADPLGLSIHEVAEGIRNIADTKMRDAIAGLIAARGYELSDYHLLAFGGAGPLHVAGYTEGLTLKGRMIFPYSSVFSAFGAASSDFEHHYNRSVNVVVPPSCTADDVLEFGPRLTKLWAEMRVQAMDQMEREGFAPNTLRFLHLAMVRYGRQLNDLIVTSPVTKIESFADWQALVEAFETMYERIYARAAKYPQAGYEIFEIGLVATASKIRPKIRKEPLGSSIPAADAEKSSRDVWFGNRPHRARVFELSGLGPGNEIAGPAIIEDPTTTLVVPPGRHIHVDGFRTILLD